MSGLEIALVVVAVLVVATFVFSARGPRGQRRRVRRPPPRRSKERDLF
jgi:hypothetical protein